MGDSVKRINGPDIPSPSQLKNMVDLSLESLVKSVITAHYGYFDKDNDVDLFKEIPPDSTYGPAMVFVLSLLRLGEKKAKNRMELIILESLNVDVAEYNNYWNIPD